jgi:hypothetical protein
MSEPTELHVRGDPQWQRRGVVLVLHEDGTVTWRERDEGG